MTTAPTVVPAWLAEEISSVPPLDEFASADELTSSLWEIAEDHPDVCSVRRVGTSRLGEPLLCLTVDGGPGVHGEALVFGLPHPNEPVGGLTALHLARRLAEDAHLRALARHTWHVVACIDPDGLRLNEGWLAGPFTREHYGRNFYRQAGHEQIEWTFPLDHKDAYFDAVLPESLTLMRLIDQHRPTLMASLHNADTGGVYHYVSRDEPDLYPLLQAIPAMLGLPLHLGEPEAPWIPRLADGVFRSPDLRDAYDHLEPSGLTGTLSGGNSTGSYAERHGTFTLVSEVPYWSDARIDDEEPGDRHYADLLAEQGGLLVELGGLLTDVIGALDPVRTVESPFLRAVRYYAALAGNAGTDLLRRAVHQDPVRTATVAEIASTSDMVHLFRLRYGGMLLRALEGELAVGNVRGEIRAAYADLSTQYEEWCAEAARDTPARTIPIRSLVATQYASVLAAAAHLSR